MRYKLSEDIILAGKLTVGATVTIKILDLATDTFIALTSNSCTESSNIPGLYLWSTNNITTTVTGYKNCYYEMTDNSNTISGKFVYGGYIEDMDTQLDGMDSKLDSIDTQLDDVDTQLASVQATASDSNGKIGILQVSVDAVPTASENASELLGTTI